MGMAMMKNTGSQDAPHDPQIPRYGNEVWYGRYGNEVRHGRYGNEIRYGNANEVRNGNGYARIRTHQHQVPHPDSFRQQRYCQVFLWIWNGRWYDVPNDDGHGLQPNDDGWYDGPRPQRK